VFPHLILLEEVLPALTRNSSKRIMSPETVPARHCALLTPEPKRLNMCMCNRSWIFGWLDLF